LLVGAEVRLDLFLFVQTTLLWASDKLLIYTVNVRLGTALVIVAAALVCPMAGRAQNLILNGDFEAEPHDPSSTILDWTLSGTGQAHSAMEGATSGSFSAALNIGGDSEGTQLSQSFATTIGQAYKVEFDSGIFGIPIANQLQLNVQVLGSGTLVNEIIAPPVAFTTIPADVVFHHYTFFFTADNTTTTLQFTDIGLGNAAADTLVDTVSVVPTTIPPPTELPLENWDFESAPYDVNGTVLAWTVTGAGQIAVSSEGATTGNHGAVFSPGGDFQDDTLSQRFFTTAGQQYVLDFDAAVFGVTDSTPSLRVRVVGNAAPLDQILTPPYVGTFDPNSVQFQHYHFVFTADSSVSTLEFSDIGTGNFNADVVVDSVSVAPSPPSFAQWQAANFTPDQLNDPQVSGWTADPDQDGIANGLEYFFGMDPLAGLTLSDADLVPTVAIEVFGSSHYLTYSFPRLLGWAGNAAVVSVSDDLVTWDDTGNQIEPVSVIPSGDGVTEIVKVRLTTPIGNGPIPKKFLRLKLTQ
jgi:hypothetical protein